MCGIFAYLGSNPELLKMLVDGLQRLEYRGYDSAGVCVHAGSDKEFYVAKSAGKVANLKNKIGPITAGSLRAAPADGEALTFAGIAHTRWATHGKPTDGNAHPHIADAPTGSPTGSAGNVASSTKSYVADQIAVVHNGIIENYAELKSELQSKGYVFKSETDSEVLAVLVMDFRKELPSADLPTAVSAALDICVGTYGAVFLFKDRPDTIIGARRGSPLILGLKNVGGCSDNSGVGGSGKLRTTMEEGEESEATSSTAGELKSPPEFFLASDACAIVQHTRDVIYLNDGETVELTKKGYTIHDTVRLAAKARRTTSVVPGSGLGASSEGEVINPIVRLELQLEEIEKGGFSHFMMKEIHDQPNTLRNCIAGRLKKLEGQKLDGESPRQVCGGDYSITLGGLAHVVDEVSGETVGDRMLNSGKVIMCACGTSWHSALIGEYLFEQLARISVEVEYASEFRYRKPVLRDTDVIVGVSQSGETADTLEAIRLAHNHGAVTFGVVNVVGSTIARETDAGMYLHAGPEVGVASTKAFTGQVLALFLMALYLAKKGSVITDEEFASLSEQCLSLPDIVKSVVNGGNDIVHRLSRECRLANNFLFLGRGLNFPVALEGALKLKEISYIHAEGYPAAEMKHGPIALIDQFMPVLVICPRSDPTYVKVKANIEEVFARNGSLIIITDEGNNELDIFSEYVLKLPISNLDQYLQPIVNVIPLQLLSFHVAKLRGCEIDQPRNLAKSVTVE